MYGGLGSLLHLLNKINSISGFSVVLEFSNYMFVLMMNESFKKKQHAKNSIIGKAINIHQTVKMLML
jgi:hypothetical protein